MHEIGAPFAPWADAGLVAGDAHPDRVGPALARLRRQLRVADLRPGHAAEVGSARGKEALRDAWLVDPARRDHGEIDGRPDRPRVGCDVAGRHRHRGGDVHAAAETRGRAEIDAEVIDEPGALDRATHLQRLVRAQADLVHLVRAHPHPERHLVVQPGAHRFEHLVQKPEARPLRAPVLVAAPVDTGIEELRDEVPVVGHHLDSLKARRAHASRRVAVCLDHLPDQLARHRARDDLVALASQRRRRVGDRDRTVVAGARDVAASGMVELAEGRRAVSADAFDDTAVGFDACIGMRGGVASRPDRGVVHRGGLADDEPRPSPRPCLVVHPDAIVGEPAARHEGPVCGGHDAVAQRDPAEDEGRKQKRKLLRHCAPIH